MEDFRNLYVLEDYYCTNPFCDCDHVTISLNDKENEENRFSFIVHFNKGTALLPNHPALTEKQKKILEEFKGELTDEMILHFKQRYMEAKAYGEKKPLSYLVFEPGQFVNYMEVSPRTSKLLDFSYKDQKHFAEDAYELDPRNDNKSIRLTFFKFEQDDEKVPPLFTYTYYFNETRREEEDAKLDAKQADMLLQFHQFIPNLHEILKDRYKETKQIGEELMKNAPDLKIQAHKPLRNDLCPCGSGKKYKKCCALKLN
ncbi:YecA family protein [Nitrospina watsonii]|uniref:SEC-C motif-containing protein n=1 Tax=Nitrospina watsonii TaxID=1323948 RepID=A0ABM9HFT2_9BACT|nr:SEC-C domain-containing protein [Nitrospina watsonii]CAI2719084.1 conserved protein of unknown function [Nitrospina watsonii]